MWSHSVIVIIVVYEWRLFFIFYIWLYFTIASDVTTGDTLELVDCCTLACILFQSVLMSVLHVYVGLL